MKKLFLLGALASVVGLAGAADTTLIYCNVDNLATGSGLPSDCGLSYGWTTDGYTGVDTVENLGFPKRVASNANEKAISLRDSGAYNVIYQTNADTTPDFCPADQRISFYGYAKWNLVTDEETDFGVILRASGAPLTDTAGALRKIGYFSWFASKNSSWTCNGESFYPSDMTPFIIRGNTTWEKVVGQNESSYLPSDDAWHKYVAEAKGDTIRMYVDDVMILEATDSDASKFSAGYMMLVAYWDCDATDSNGKQSTMGVEEIKFEKIDNWSSVDDWSLL